MARGQKQAADAQLKKTNAIGDQYNAAGAEIGGFTEPRYKKLATSGYFSPAEEAAATNSVMGGAAAPFESAKFEANNTAARTNNAADLTANQDQLALSEGRTAGEAADQLQNDKMKNQLAGMYGLSGMRSEDLNAMEAMYGLGPGTLQSRAAGGGWSQGFHDVATGISSVMGLPQFGGGGKSS